MALQAADMELVATAFGDHGEPERRVDSMVARVTASGAACVDALAALNVDLAHRWNDSAELLDRVEIGVDALRRAADRHTTVLAEARRRAMGVMKVLGESAEEAGEGLDEQRPDMVEKMEALLTVLASRTSTLQDTTNSALTEWAGFLASQDPELRQLVTSSEEASAGMDKVIDEAHQAVDEAVAGLNQRFTGLGTSSEQLDTIEEKVIAPAFNRWAVAVDDLPEAVEQAVTALLAEFTEPATEAGTQVAQGAADVQKLAEALSTRMGPVLQDLTHRRWGIDAAVPNLERLRDGLPETVAQCRETAKALGEPW